MSTRRRTQDNLQWIVMNFAGRYANLNEAQKLAVDTIDGPVMVIAGPGTGKTELLSVRAANILQKTDTLPENILCLTFTESGASAMRQRLTEIIGKEAYKVAIHTFHSFGSEVINQNGEFFYDGAHFRPVDEVSTYEILNDIFKRLDYNNPLAKKHGEEFTYISDSISVISELKRSGLTNDELLKILDENNAVIEKTEQLLSPVFAKRPDKNTAAEAAKHIEAIRHSSGGVILPGITPLSQVVADSLETAASESLESNSTKQITAWRNKWMQKNGDGIFVMKSRERQVKLRALCFVYGEYLARMHDAGLYDYDDMILRVVHAIEVFDDLRFNLQEKYQYIMVDEFQDTNLAQMRILHNLTNNEAHGDTPNILVVGDDDQAIYSFQGADISNIIDFMTNYPKAKLVTLTENYRSIADILGNSRDIILQGGERLEDRIEELDKNLTANNKNDGGGVFLHEAETIADERHWIVEDIKSRIASGQKPCDIAVFTRKHKEIEALLPYFHKSNIAVNYEKSDNALEQPPIIFIEQLAKLLIDIYEGRHDEANAKMPQIMAHQSWRIDPIDLWRLSIKAYDSRTRWLDIMAVTPEFIDLHNWIVTTASRLGDTPLEKMLDIIIGKPDDEQTFKSPVYDYYFSANKQNSNPDEYLVYLEALRAIRTRLKDYHPDKSPTLPVLIDFIALNRKINNAISITRSSVHLDNAVNIMTVHKSKGLEFDTVYVSNVVDNVWGDSSRGRPRLIGYPENLPLAAAGETDDERLRLFYVALTRAKHRLHISYSLCNDNNKNTLRASFLLDDKWEPRPVPSTTGSNKLLEAVELAWYQPVIEPPTTRMSDLLSPILENYKLSVTHMQNFLDVTRGGPSMFLINNLLHFPQAKSPDACFGTAIHSTLQQAHAHLSSTGKRQAVEDIVSSFESNLKIQRLSADDFKKYLQKGCDVIQKYLDEKYDSFSEKQQTELNFGGQQSMVGDAHLTGSLDLIEIDKSSKSIIVTDYKTGRPPFNQTGKDEYEKNKLYRYRQQILFYKLLVENSRDYHNFEVARGVVQFVEPTDSGNIVSIEVDFDDGELERFRSLINAVWSHIIRFDLPDVSGYEQSHKGVLAFENDLIEKII